MSKNQKTFSEMLSEALNESYSNSYQNTEGSRVIITTDDIPELLFEKAIFVDPKYNYGISVDNDSGGKFRYLPYFKFSKGKKKSMSNEIARIPILGDRNTGEYKYQIHNDGHSRHFNLNKDDFDILEYMLHQTVYPNNIATPVWEDIINTANSYIMQYPNYRDYMIDINTPIPDYRNLLSKVKGY